MKLFTIGLISGALFTVIGIMLVSMGFIFSLIICFNGGSFFESMNCLNLFLGPSALSMFLSMFFIIISLYFFGDDLT